MADENERVKVVMWTESRLRLYGQITGQMEKLGYNPVSYDELGLGFELPADWPCGDQSQPTLAQLIVVANKLKMRVIIHDLSVEPMVKDAKGKEI